MARLPRDVGGWVKLLRQGWPRQAIPADVSRGLLALVRQYQRADAEGRQRMRSAVKELLSDRLISFAHLAAEKAVRRKDANFLNHGLAALALGSKRIDPRDILVAFSLISHSADKRRIDYRRLFKGAQEFAGKEFAELVEDWLERSRFDRAIDGMGYREGTSRRGFRYIEDDENENGFDSWWFPTREG